MGWGVVGTFHILREDMEKGADEQTLSAEINENCGNFWIMDDYLLLFWNTTLFTVIISASNI